MSHGKTICKLCDKVVRQCKCMEGHKNVTEVVCDSCQKIIDKSAGIKMHHKYPNGIAFLDLPESVMSAIFKEENGEDIIDELFEWLDDKFWICHKIGAATEGKERLDQNRKLETKKEKKRGS